MIDRNLFIAGQMKPLDNGLTGQLGEGGMPILGNRPHLSGHGLGPSNLDRNGFSHERNHATSDLRCQLPNGQVGLDLCPMALGDLLRERRTVTGMSQSDVARMVPGLTRGALNNIESGNTKTISAHLANGIVKVLPVTMAEIVRSMDYDLPAPTTTLPAGLLARLEAAPEPVLEAVQLLLDGWLVQQRALAESA